jgi:hypothetical protein
VLLSSTQGKTNNTTHFVHLWLLPSWELRCLLATECQYKPWTGGPVRAHPGPYEFSTDPWIGALHLLHSWAVSRLTLSGTHSHSMVLPPAP